jgi:hypothetical protein
MTDQTTAAPSGPGGDFHAGDSIARRIGSVRSARPDDDARKPGLRAAATSWGVRPLRGRGGLAGDEDQFEAGTLRRAADICQLVTG